MRILFTFVGGQGHFDPLVPVAQAAQLAGHVVAFGCARPMATTVEAAGFAVLPLGGKAVAASRAQTPLLQPDREREDRHLRDRFVRRTGRDRVPLALALYEAWRPDVVVCDETDFGGLVAAECVGLPYATVLVIAAGSFVRAEVIGQALDELRAEHGLARDVDLGMLSRYLVLSPFPASYRDAAFPLPDTACSYRAWDVAVAPSVVPEWASQRPRQPTVYLTLGTVFNLECGDLMARVLAGLRELSINLVVTVGRQIDPATLGPQPAHVHVARYIPQRSVLPFCDLLVSHGGSGSVIGALSHGLPCVLLPIGADQPQNADRCVRLGVGRVLDPLEATPEAVRATAEVALEDLSYRLNAERIRDEIAALPGPGHTVRLLERLGAEKQPIRKG